jgi:hypothetical protein
VVVRFVDVGGIVDPHCHGFNIATVIGGMKVFI